MPLSCTGDPMHSTGSCSRAALGANAPLCFLEHFSPHPKGQRGPFCSGCGKPGKALIAVLVFEALGLGGKVFNEAHTVKICTPSQSPSPSSLAMWHYAEAT